MARNIWPARRFSTRCFEELSIVTTSFRLTTIKWLSSQIAFSSGTNSSLICISATLSDIWQFLYAAKVSVVLHEQNFGVLIRVRACEDIGAKFARFSLTLIGLDYRSGRRLSASSAKINQFRVVEQFSRELQTGPQGFAYRSTSLLCINLRHSAFILVAIRGCQSLRCEI